MGQIPGDVEHHRANPAQDPPVRPKAQVPPTEPAPSPSLNGRPPSMPGMAVSSGQVRPAAPRVQSPEHHATAYSYSSPTGAMPATDMHSAGIRTIRRTQPRSSEVDGRRPRVGVEVLDMYS